MIALPFYSCEISFKLMPNSDKFNMRCLQPKTEIHSHVYEMSDRVQMMS